MTRKQIGDVARELTDKLRGNDVIAKIEHTRPAMMSDGDRRYRCAFPGCHRSTDRYPYVVGWANLCDWGPGIPDGFYCKPHADAIEALNDNGELDYLQSGGRS